MSSSLPVQDGMVVSLAYTLKLDDGEVVDSTVDGEPLFYLHGSQNIVPGLERALAGKAVGDKVSVSVPPEDGYGLRDERNVQDVPRHAFPDDMEIEEGMQFMAEGPDGPFPVWVKIAGKINVKVDANHPLAGETLHFDVEVLEVRAALAEELKHGHPHGPDGHHHH